MTFEEFKKPAIKFFASGAFLTLITIGFIWTYLVFLGRTDLFLKAVTFESLFSFSGAIILFSFFLFMFLFYSPSFMGCLVIKREVPNILGYDCVKKSHSFILLLSTLISFTLLIYLVEFTDIEVSNYNASMILLCSTLFPIIFSLVFNRKSIIENYNISTSRKDIFRLISLFVGRAFFIGLISWMFCFPLPVLTQSLKFDNADSESIQVLKYYGLGVVVLTFTLIPAFYFIQIKKSVSYIKQSMTTFGLALLFLIALSIMLPVIPTLIVNFAARLVGINGFEVIRPAISVENRPAEKFKDPQWNLSTSADGKFYLFDGVKLFSFGTLELVCSPNVLDSYKATLHYILASKEYDEKTRKMLHKETKTCQIFDSQDLRY
ncbi:hypothetical protein [Winslowiella arboricola]|uniref:hypothetical protein n=1 Tax=Winslowiella arboricola TaxID=2978220 RepID=UPI00225E2AA2|nr:hypothetical protein [Winslowiella arboricola]MCU5773016.1 hypothetical protein [Winslowiella arboricola]